MTPSDGDEPGVQGIGSEARAHHLVPKFYLDRFAVGGEINVVELWDGRPPYTTGTAVVAVENDFYRLRDPGDAGDATMAERALGEVEGAAAEAIERASFGALFPPMQKDREAMCLFLAFQLVRGRRHRRNLEAMADAVTKLMLSRVTNSDDARRYLVREGVPAPTDRQIEAVVYAAQHPDEFEFSPSTDFSIALLFDVALKMVPVLIEKDWAVGKFREPSLLTSDSPVTMYKDPEHRDPLSGTGIGTADEIWFPLDPRSVLVLAPPDRFAREQVVSMPDGAAQSFNQNTVGYAFERIFTTPGMSLLDGLEMPTEPEPLVRFEGGGVEHRTDGVNRPPVRRGPRRTKRR